MACQVSVTTESATRSATLSQVYVTGLACAMASVRQMSQVWHVVRQMSQVWHVSWRLCVNVMASVCQMSCHVMLKLPLR